jgi:hypothetical protein
MNIGEGEGGEKGGQSIYIKLIFIYMLHKDAYGNIYFSN